MKKTKKRKRDGYETLVALIFHIFYSYIPLRFLEMIFITCFTRFKGQSFIEHNNDLRVSTNERALGSMASELNGVVQCHASPMIGNSLAP